MASMSSVQLIYFAFVGINSLVFAPIICYYCYQLWKLQDEPLLSKRYPKIIYSVVFFILVYTNLFRLIADLPRIIPSIKFGSSTSTECIRLFLYNIFHIGYALYLYRAWLLYYDYTKGIYLIQYQFHSQIVNNNDNKHWTLKYSKYLSHKSPALYSVCILWVLLAVTCTTLSGLVDQQHIIQPAMVGIVVVASVIIAIKVRRCRDECFFLWETKRIAAVFLAYLVVYNIIIIILKHDQHQLRALLTYVITMILSFLASIIATKEVIKKCQIRSRINENSKDSGKKLVPFINILSNKDAFDLFAVHLVKEFSLENLLFLYESMKFKLECVKHGFINDDQFGVNLDFGENMNSKIQREQSTFGKNTDPYYFVNYNLDYIIDRYVSSNGEYCINVSSSTRNKIQLTKLSMDHKAHKANKILSNVGEIIAQFISSIDVAITEIIHLIKRDSYQRFCGTDQFKQLYQ